MSNNYIRKLQDFLSEPISFQQQAMFEFRYPYLFGNDSFLIEQLNLPKVDTNVVYAYLDGYKIPVHSTATFDNEISFTMYADEKDFNHDTGKYFDIVNSLMNPYHFSYLNNHRPRATEAPLKAVIIPLQSDYDFYQHGNGKQIELDVNNTIVLYNALIKSISFSGGFAANATTLLKYDVTLTFSHILVKDKAYNHV